MKQTFYLHKYIKGDVVLSVGSQLRELKPIGTIELDVQPIKKEVEKVIEKPYLMCFPEGKQITNYLPMDSYDITVTYKIKE